jgi:hypothetical protein
VTETPAQPATSLDPDLARWLERSEALFGRDTALAAAALPGNPAGAATIDVGGGVAVALGAAPIGLFNRALGLGFDEPLTEDHVAAVDRFFAERHAPVSVVQLAPSIETPEAIGWLAAHGYRPGGAWVKVWHDLAVLPDAATDIRVDTMGPDRSDDFVRIALEAFEMPPVVASFASATIGRPGWRHYLGFDGDEPVSIAALYVTEGVAWLGYGATLEAARGQGGQSAMLARRLRDAKELGCRFAITETGEETEEEPVNHSYRNMLRSGFRLAYARRNYVRRVASPDAG